jgi:DNA-binding transcriptional ArsR family regulator
MDDSRKCKSLFSALIQSMTTAAKPRTRAKTAPRSKARTSAPNTPLSPEEQPSDIFALIGKSENIEQAAVAMQAMAHPMRIKILCMLSSGELPVQEIVDAVGTTQSNVSQHLGILKASGMISAKRDATRVLYRIADKRVLRMITLTRDIFCDI